MRAPIATTMPTIVAIPANDDAPVFLTLLNMKHDTDNDISNNDIF